MNTKFVVTLLLTVGTSINLLAATQIPNQAHSAEDLNNSPQVTQHKWSAYDWVDTCTTKYAVVHDWIGRCGIYDLENHRNLTELEYRDLYFRKMMDLEDGSQSTMFYGSKGRMEGIVTVSPSGSIMTMMMPDDELYYTLDSCNTIDKHLSKLCKKLLNQSVTVLDSVQYAQVLVMDTKKGDIKAWVALKEEDGKMIDAELRNNQCSMMALKSMLACFGQDTTKLAYYPRDLDAMDIAATYSSIANGGNVIHPSVRENARNLR